MVAAKPAEPESARALITRSHHSLSSVSSPETRLSVHIHSSYSLISSLANLLLASHTQATGHAKLSRVAVEPVKSLAAPPPLSIMLFFLPLARLSEGSATINKRCSLHTYCLNQNLMRFSCHFPLWAIRTCLRILPTTSATPSSVVNTTSQLLRFNVPHVPAMQLIAFISPLEFLFHGGRSNMRGSDRLADMQGLPCQSSVSHCDSIILQNHHDILEQHCKMPSLSVHIHETSFATA
jgi:hypothetical protein